MHEGFAPLGWNFCEKITMVREIISQEKSDAKLEKGTIHSVCMYISNAGDCSSFLIDVRKKHGIYI